MRYFLFYLALCLFMGFAGGAGEDPLDDIQAQAKLIETALQMSGYAVDGTVEGLREIDRFLDDHWDDATRQPRPGGGLAVETGWRLVLLGLYIGEVIRIAAGGGKWSVGLPEDGLDTVSVSLDKGERFWPVERVFKRCVEGKHNGIYEYALPLTEG